MRIDKLSNLPPVVLLAFAAVAVENHLPLPRLADEAAQLREVLEEAARAGRCELILRENVTLKQILDAFQRADLHGRIAVLHFAGHADSYELLLEEVAGRKLLVDAGGLAAFLGEQPGLRLVFLNACSTQEQVAALHAAGVPAVVATTQDVPDDWAMPFAVRFYTGLTGGMAVAAAFRAALAEQRALRGEREEWPWRLYWRSEQDVEWKLGDLMAAQVPWRVPFLRNESFVGREQELEVLHSILTESRISGMWPAPTTGSASAAGLAGMGGIGKTQLAVEYCYRYKDSYPSGVFWINAAADWREEFAELGVYLEPQLAGEPEVRRIRAAADYLKSHAECLVVLDNVTDPAQLRRPVTPELLPAGLPCRLLLTTRRRDLRDLGDVRTVEVTVLAEEAALQLLLRHVSLRPVLEPMHAEHEAARLICANLGYLPLALEIAGAHLGKRRQLALTAYRQHLLARGALTIVDDARGGVRDEDLGTRHKAAVAATLAEQWDTIDSENARLLLRVAGQLPEATAIPSVRLGLLAGVANDLDGPFGTPLELALAELEQLSLLESLRNDEVRLHPLVREFAAGKTSVAETPSFREGCAERLLAAYRDVAVLEQQCALRDVDAVEQDLLSALALLPAFLPAQEQSETTVRTGLQRLLRMVQQESHTLRGWNQSAQPTHFLQQWRKRTLAAQDWMQADAAAAKMAERAVAYLLMQWTAVRENSALERTLSGHTGTVHAVAVSPDGRRAVSASGDHTLRIWDLESGRELYTLSGHSGDVNSVAVTPDGQRAVSGSSDRSLKVWDLASGTELHTLAGHNGAINAVAVSPDGWRAISASHDSTLKLWDLHSGKELHTLAGHTSSVEAIVVTAAGQRLVSGSRDGTLRVWELASGRELYSLKGHAGWVTAVAVTIDEQQAVSASDDKTLRVWDLENRRELHTLRGHANAVGAVAVTKQGRPVAVSASSDKTLKVWDLELGRELHTLRGHTSVVGTVAITPDGRRAISGALDNTLKLWDLEAGRELHTFSGHTGWVFAVAITPDGRRAVSTSAAQDCTLKVWDLESKHEQHAAHCHSGAVKAVAVSADGRWAVSASKDGTVKVWDIESGRELHTLSGHQEWVSQVAITADGRWVVTASHDRTLKVWDVGSGREVRYLRGHIDYVNAVTFARDEQWAVSAGSSHDKTLKVWDLINGSLVHTLRGHTRGVRALAADPSGWWVVSGSDDTTLKVWDLESGTEIHTLRGHTRSANAVAIVPTRRWAVSGSEDSTLKLWDLESGRELRTFRGHGDRITAVSITQDGRQLVSAAADMTLMLWDLVSGQLIHTLRGHGGEVVAAAITSDGRRVVSAADDHTIKVWGLESGVCLADITLDAAVGCVAVAPAGNTIVAGDAVGNVHCLAFCAPARA